MIINIKEYTNFNKLFKVVSGLRVSQGFYSKLYNNLVFEILDIENELPDFYDELDVIMYLEI